MVLIAGVEASWRTSDWCNYCILTSVTLLYELPPVVLLFQSIQLQRLLRSAQHTGD